MERRGYKRGKGKRTNRMGILGLLLRDGDGKGRKMRE